MILLDTSVWVEHLRFESGAVAGLLNAEQVVMHPFVIGELVLGHLGQHVLENLQELPGADVADDDEVLKLVRRHSLAGSGIGYVDAHLLAAARLSPDTLLWTFDKRLEAAAVRLGVAHRFLH